MSGIRLAAGGRHYDFDAGATVSIGRATDNDVTIEDATVSRHHVRIHPEGSGWALEAVGSRPTFVDGREVTSAALTGNVEIRLVSLEGPAIGVEVQAVGAPHPETPGHETVLEVEPAPKAKRVAAHRPATPAITPQHVTPEPAPVPGTVKAHHDGELASAFHILFPFRSWFHNPGWRQGFRLLTVPYALLPVIYLCLFANSTKPSTPGWAYALYVAPLWAIAFWFLIKPGRFTRMIGVFAAAVCVFEYVYLNAVTGPLEGSCNIAHFGGALCVGYDEETSKALPVFLLALILLRWRKQKWDVRAWMWLGTVSGLAFGVIEASLYTKDFLLTILNQPSSAILEILQFAERVFVDGFQHAIWAGISGFFVGIAINYSRRRIPILIFGISLPALLHACNDYFLSAPGLPHDTLWVTVQTVSLLIFLGYTMSAHAIERDVRRSSIFRGESMLADPPSVLSEA